MDKKRSKRSVNTKDIGMLRETKKKVFIATFIVDSESEKSVGNPFVNLFCKRKEQSDTGSFEERPTDPDVNLSLTANSFMMDE